MSCCWFWLCSSLPWPPLSFFRSPADPTNFRNGPGANGRLSMESRPESRRDDEGEDFGLWGQTTPCRRRYCEGVASLLSSRLEPAQRWTCRDRRHENPRREGSSAEALVEGSNRTLGRVDGAVGREHASATDGPRCYADSALLTPGSRGQRIAERRPSRPRPRGRNVIARKRLPVG